MSWHPELFNKAHYLIVLEKLLKDHSLRHNLSLYNINVTKEGRENEIDYITELDGRRLIAECKELKRGINDKQIREIITQLRTQVALAKKIEADAVLLGTFLDEIPNEFTQKILKLNTKDIAVHIISLRKKKIVDLYNPDKFKDFSKWDLFTPFSPAA